VSSSVYFESEGQIIQLLTVTVGQVMTVRNASVVYNNNNNTQKLMQRI
jgi:hypothetical protein